jgi:hypothetical protein
MGGATDDGAADDGKIPDYLKSDEAVKAADDASRAQTPIASF